MNLRSFGVENQKYIKYQINSSFYKLKHKENNFSILWKISFEIMNMFN